ncbi:hypothetical protein BgiBS90_019210 [Biomphalaria glabrata]|nr:hypothetical protein BgiBS90_019210 [Biomphalaria glabrata]
MSWTCQIPSTLLRRPVQALSGLRPLRMLQLLGDTGKCWYRVGTKSEPSSLSRGKVCLSPNVSQATLSRGNDCLSPRVSQAPSVEGTTACLLEMPTLVDILYKPSICLGRSSELISCL